MKKKQYKAESAGSGTVNKLLTEVEGPSADCQGSCQ